MFLLSNSLGLLGWPGPGPVTSIRSFLTITNISMTYTISKTFRWVLTLTMTNMWYPQPEVSAPFAFPAWTITTLTAFYLAFPTLLSILSQFNSRQLNVLIIVLFLSQLLPSLLFFNAGCEMINDLLCRHPLPRYLWFNIQRLSACPGYQCLWWEWLQA